MITLAQINAETLDPMTDEQVLALELLVKRFKGYYTAIGFWPQLSERLRAEQDVPTVKTQALKAVVTALGDLPEIVVESEGQRNSPGFFATRDNWDALAMDTLNILYDKPAYVMSVQKFGVVNKPVQGATIKDDVWLPESKTGRKY